VLQQTTDGGFIVTGSGAAEIGHGSSGDMYVIKTNENGLKQRDKSL
jgi:hypothetical protein